jgi:hypothetical protein
VVYFYIATPAAIEKKHESLTRYQFKSSRAHNFSNKKARPFVIYVLFYEGGSKSKII